MLTFLLAHAYPPVHITCLLGMILVPVLSLPLSHRLHSVSFYPCLLELHTPRILRCLRNKNQQVHWKEYIRPVYSSYYYAPLPRDACEMARLNLNLNPKFRKSTVWLPAPRFDVFRRSDPSGTRKITYATTPIVLVFGKHPVGIEATGSLHRSSV
ncbi:hypothetical protein LXA43DRAFT_646352 [Ganoderma leucocontextum]|nr:hypothetical protein LXA43DRAFT_646352 [Ganoderma leucocontextum]